VRFVSRVLGWIVVAVALPGIGGGLADRIGAVAGAGAAIVAVLGFWIWLPRAAHAAFEAGRHARAARRYRVLEAITWSTVRARAARLSRIGCAVAAGELDLAERLGGDIDGAGLAAAERAVWLNNRACAALAGGGDPQAALALVDEASALRPDVPAVQHTRGMALLAVGRIDDAIGVLDGMRAGGELPARLEAERCRELARAWSAKGEAAYADDYRARADAVGR
jgi:predicted Zn-dependent protease